jgi:hypothetical protein
VIGAKQEANLAAQVQLFNNMIVIKLVGEVGKSNLEPKKKIGYDRKYD